MITAILLLYGLFLLVYAALSFLALYQLWQFGYVGDASQRMIGMYIIISVSVVLSSLVVIFFLLASR